MKELASVTSLGEAVKDKDAVILICFNEKDPKKLKEQQETLVTLAKDLEKLSESRPPVVEVVLWDLVMMSDEKKGSLVLNLGIRTLPAALAIHKGKVLDKVEGLKECQEVLPGFYGKFCKYIGASSTVSVSTSSGKNQDGAETNNGATLNVNISKMLLMGNDLMAKGQVGYAEKFFIKATSALEAVVEGEKIQNEDVDGSMVECLGSTIVAKCVQGKVHEAGCQELMKKISEPKYKQFTSVPNSTGGRALAVYNMLHPAPFEYVGERCSIKKLSEELSQRQAAKEKGDKEVDSLAHDIRGCLLVTYFLAGKMEEAFTEGLKLWKFGTAENGAKYTGERSLNALCDFLGTEDPLVKKSLWLEHRPSN